MIEARGLTKRYGDKLAVDQLTFTVEPGQDHRLPRPERGRQDDNDAADPWPGPAHPWLGHRARQGVRPPRAIRCTRSARCSMPRPCTAGAAHITICFAWRSPTAFPAPRVGEVLELVGLTEVARKRSRGFSLGMGQRLGIAAALLGDPAILMFDEPVNGLDPEGILWIRNLMKALAAEGRTIFVSSHLMSEMENTADHLLVIGRAG